MNCCPEPNPSPLELTDANQRRACIFCQGQTIAVTRRTMLLMLKPDLLSQVGEQQYRFCGSPGCRVVYFSAENHFTISDVRLRIGVKETSGFIRLCYCFGFSEQDMLDEIRTLGYTTIAESIASLCQERMSACGERNPAGVCCLGEVMEATKRLLKEAKWRGSESSLVE